MNVILGISAASGLGIGPAFVVPEDTERIIPKEKITPAKVASGWKKFEQAVEKIQASIAKSLDSLEKDNLHRVIFETYQLMLADPVFLQELREAYEEQKYNIEYVLNKKVIEYADRLRNSGNEYLAERAQDIEDVFDRVIDELIHFHPFNIEEIPDGVVIVARALKASDTVILSKRKIAGLALTEGGVSSHVAILAKSYGIPAVVALENVTTQIENGEQVIVDGTLGEVVSSPDTATIIGYNAKVESERKHRLALEKFRDLPGKTKDGTEFTLLANIGTPEEAKFAVEEGADGIGLFRTEFLLMSIAKSLKENGGSLSGPISEELQFEAYKQVLQTMGDKPVTIRTLDAGGDKLLSANDLPVTDEKNPLMGLRAVRLSLFYPNILRTQLRALFRASVYGNLKIMFPLITDVSQVETLRGISKGVMYQLKSEKIPYNPDVPIGIMIETAAAALTADCLAPHSDFFSIGTNDLTQYTLGVDRENPAVAPLYNEFHLAVLRMIELTIKNAKEANIPVSVCGEMASRKESVLVLAGLGIKQLSMSPKQIPVIKETLSQFTLKELQTISCRSLN